MSLVFAYECFADSNVARFLRDSCGIPLTGRHSGGQGNVVNAVRERQAHFGMIDEDPRSHHHKNRDDFKAASTKQYLQLCVLEDRFLILLRPELEECFLASMSALGLRSEMGDNPKIIRNALAKPNHPWHNIFASELDALYRTSRDRGTASFITELDDVIRDIAPRLPIP